jgi:DMSO/TMAO reductase YedYZ heme-binding membrane subunit
MGGLGSATVSPLGAVSMRRVGGTTHSDWEGTDEVESVQIASSRQGTVRRGPPLGRHAAAVSLVVVLMLQFVWLQPGPDYEGPPYLSNLVLADTSLVLLCLILMLGAVARFTPRLRPVVPWARELGIGMFVTASLHVVILLAPNDDIWVPFLGERTSFGMELGTDFWGAANWVGLIALGYALILAAISNDLSQRWLGRGWKFVQRQAYTLFVLAWLHTAAFVLLDAGHGSSFLLWFWAFTAMAVVAQFAGFVHTVGARRGSSPQRASAKVGPAGPTIAAIGAAKWVAVTALWGGLIIGSWSLATAESNEEKQVPLLCERYDELQGFAMAEIRDELIEFVPANEPPGTLDEWLETCQDD